MAYTKTIWENSPSTNSPLNANNLNKIEQGIYDLDQNTYKTENVAVLTDTLTLPEAGSGSLTTSIHINYPNGFTSTNCVIISIMAKVSGSTQGYCTTQQPSVSSYVNGSGGLFAKLNSEYILVGETKLNDAQAGSTIDVKVTLLKI